MEPKTRFMEVEQKQMNYPSFPLSKFTEDLEKELDQISSMTITPSIKELDSKKGY